MNVGVSASVSVSEDRLRLRLPLALLALAACGAKPPQSSWIERDVHATEGTAGRTPAHVDLSKLEAGALELFGHALPPVASGDVSFRYWRPAVAGRAALLVGFSRGKAAFCHGYRLVGRIAMPTANAERGQPIARCTLDRTLAAAWPQIVRFSG